MLRCLITICCLMLSTIYSNAPVNTLLDPLVQNNKESSTLEAARIARQRISDGLPVYNWGLGANPFEIPHSLVEAVKEHAHQAPYTSVEGIPGLSDAIASIYSVGDYKIAEQGVIVAPGLKQILFDAQRAFGGDIIHVAPYWVSYTEQTKLMGKKAIEIQTKESNNYKLCPDELEEVCQQNPDTPKLLIFNNPCNPTGQTYSKRELTELASVMKKYPLYVLADEVYLGNTHHGEKHSIAEYLPNRTIRTSSLSKEFAAGGYRLGWATFPSELMELKKAMASIGSSTYSCAAVPQQYAALVAMEQYESFEERMSQIRFILKHLGQRCANRLQNLGVKCISPEAAWYLLLDFSPFQEALNKRGIHTSEELTKALISEVGLVFVPGNAFGIEESKLMVRASYVDFSGKDALKSCESLDLSQNPEEQFFHPWSGKIEESIEVLETWLGRQTAAD